MRDNMDLTVEMESNNKLKCIFSGRLDTLNSMEAESKILEHINNNNIESVLFDLRNVDYIASYFLRLCSVVVDKINNKEDFTINNVNPNVYKVFKMAGLCEHLNIK